MTKQVDLEEVKHDIPFSSCAISPIRYPDKKGESEKFKLPDLTIDSRLANAENGT